MCSRKMRKFFPNKGETFSFFFPLSPPEADKSNPGRSGKTVPQMVPGERMRGLWAGLKRLPDSHALVSSGLRD